VEGTREHNGEGDPRDDVESKPSRPKAMIRTTLLNSSSSSFTTGPERGATGSLRAGAAARAHGDEGPLIA
jgi:hypothetical protein